MQFEEVVRSEAVDRCPPGAAFARRVRGKHKGHGILAGFRHAVDEDIDGSEVPAFVLVERSPRFRSAVLKHVFGRAPHEGLDVSGRGDRLRGYPVIGAAGVSACRQRARQSNKSSPRDESSGES